MDVCVKLCLVVKKRVGTALHLQGNGWRRGMWKGYVNEESKWIVLKYYKLIF